MTPSAYAPTKRKSVSSNCKLGFYLSKSSGQKWLDFSGKYIILQVTSKEPNMRVATKCLTCSEGYNNRVSSCDEEGNWSDKGLCLKCEHCGAFSDDGGKTWTKTCSTCGNEVDKLVGLFVPHNCVECQKAKVEKEVARGEVCRMCRQVYSNCCC